MKLAFACHSHNTYFIFLQDQERLFDVDVVVQTFRCLRASSVDLLGWIHPNESTDAVKQRNYLMLMLMSKRFAV